MLSSVSRVIFMGDDFQKSEGVTIGPCNDGASVNVEYSPALYLQGLDLSPHLVPLGGLSLSACQARLHHFGCLYH